MAQLLANTTIGGKSIVDIVYPVGSIYMSWNNTNPATLFGGSWTRLSGGYMYGCQESAGTGNGTGTATNSHTLTANQIPSHQHTVYLETTGYSGWETRKNDSTYVLNYNGTVIANQGAQKLNAHMTLANYGITSSTGGGQGHSHNIPYIAVFVWRRTA